MHKHFWMAPALTGIMLVVQTGAASPFATSVVSYNSGSGFIAAYTNTIAVVGAPTVKDAFDTPITPFYAPWEKTHLISIGSGGSLIVAFDAPIQNAAGNPYGLDLLIFNGAGFNVPNYTGTPADTTDGTFYSVTPSVTRVSVSQDGSTYYTLDPVRAPVVEGLYPTDAAGNVFQPVNPALTSADFAGKTLAGISALYGGSAGGTGYDLAWAQDGGGQPVGLSSASYVKIEVLSGVVEVDAFAAVPEPSTYALGMLGGALMFLWRRNRRKAC